MTNTTYIEEIELSIEEMEEVIAPSLTYPTINHNETVEVDLELEIEEMEEAITPVVVY